MRSRLGAGAYLVMVTAFGLLGVLVFVAGTALASAAQEPDGPTRQAAIEQQQAEKAGDLHPYTPDRAESRAVATQPLPLTQAQRTIIYRTIIPQGRGRGPIVREQIITEPVAPAVPLANATATAIKATIRREPSTRAHGRMSVGSDIDGHVGEHPEPPGLAS